MAGAPEAFSSHHMGVVSWFKRFSVLRVLGFRVQGFRVLEFRAQGLGFR